MTPTNTQWPWRPMPLVGGRAEEMCSERVLPGLTQSTHCPIGSEGPIGLESRFGTSRDIAAIDRQAGAGVEACSGAGEVGDQPSNFLRLAHASERDEGFHLRDVTSCHVGVCGA